MKKSVTGILLLLFFCGHALWAQSHGTDVRQLAAMIDARYNGMKSLRADFNEVYSGGRMRRSESGTLWIKKPGKMRWDYTSPQKKVFVTNGATAWFYVPGEHQARRTPLKKLDDLRSPLRYLLGRTKLEKELRGLSLALDVRPEKTGNVVLRGIPVGMEDRVSQVLLESDAQGFLRRIVMDELDGSRTEFRLENQRENLAISDAEFNFHPPAGVEVLQSEQLEP
ncbi:MAG: outer membrane lipoprotein carrier protein LolA [Acidobacteria bacterium]|nr:MAG: outer membrane lipoprotein carrier protein LolA [Acidobacteriota bacterium]